MRAVTVYIFIFTHCTFNTVQKQTLNHSSQLKWNVLIIYLLTNTFFRLYLKSVDVLLQLCHFSPFRSSNISWRPLWWNHNTVDLIVPYYYRKNNSFSEFSGRKQVKLDFPLIKVIYLVMSSYTPYPVFLSWTQRPMKTLEEFLASLPELSMP